MTKTGSLVLVTGGGGAMGCAIARALAADGWSLVLIDRDQGAADHARESIGSAVFGTYTCDVRDLNAANVIVTSVKEKYGRIDGLVTAAGGGKAVGPKRRFWETDIADWRLTMETHLNGVMTFCYAVIPHMRAQGSGAIVNVASAAALPGGPPGIRQVHTEIYSASKAGVIGFTEALALEHAADGIRANCIAPGRSASAYRTTEELTRIAQEEEARAPGSSRRPPIGRFGRSEDMGNAAAFLMSERASYITGACLDVTGGLKLH